MVRGSHGDHGGFMAHLRGAGCYLALCHARMEARAAGVLNSKENAHIFIL